MRYKEAIRAVDTEKALGILGLQGEKDGSYLKFDAPCGHKVVIRTFGEKKNMIFCPDCKKGSNIFQLALNLKGISYADLVKKASKPQQPIEDELNLSYDLEWCKEMEKLELDQELCHTMFVGKPKGKTMLSGHIVFTVFNEKAVKIAYFGVKPDGAIKCHSSFNAETYLYNYHNCDPTEEVWITDNMFECLRLISQGKQACSNFGLPYLSVKQYLLLSDLDRVVFDWSGDKRDVAHSNIASLKTFYRFA